MASKIQQSSATVVIASVSVVTPAKAAPFVESGVVLCCTPFNAIAAAEIPAVFPG